MGLKELRDKYNITEAEMADMMGMSVGNYQRLERGRRGLTKGHRATMRLIDRLYTDRHRRKTMCVLCGSQYN